MTHAHPEGVAGAVAVALASCFAAQGVPPEPGMFLEHVIRELPPSEACSSLVRAQSIASPRSLPFAISVLGNRVEMSAQDTVPFALWCCVQHLASYPDALWLALAGGDRDTILRDRGRRGGLRCGRGRHPARVACESMKGRRGRILKDGLIA